MDNTDNTDDADNPEFITNIIALQFKYDMRHGFNHIYIDLHINHTV